MNCLHLPADSPSSNATGNKVKWKILTPPGNLQYVHLCKAWLWTTVVSWYQKYYWTDCSVSGSWSTVAKEWDLEMCPGGVAAVVSWWEVLGNTPVVPEAEVLKHRFCEAVGREEGRWQCWQLCAGSSVLSIVALLQPAGREQGAVGYSVPFIWVLGLTAKRLQEYWKLHICEKTENYQ